MTLRQLAKRVRQLGYHLEYQEYIEDKIAENTAEIKNYMLETGKDILALNGCKITLSETGELTLDCLPVINPQTISLFEWLEKVG